MSIPPAPLPVVRTNSVIYWTCSLTLKVTQQLMFTIYFQRRGGGPGGSKSQVQTQTEKISPNWVSQNLVCGRSTNYAFKQENRSSPKTIMLQLSSSSFLFFLFFFPPPPPPPFFFFFFFLSFLLFFSSASSFPFCFVPQQLFSLTGETVKILNFSKASHKLFIFHTLFQGLQNGR